MTESMLPILTKVDPTDKELDIEAIKDDLEEIMKTNLKKFLNTLQSGVDTECHIDDDDFKLYNSPNTRMNVAPEKRKIISEYQEREKFYESFVSSMIVVDPLDRIDKSEYPGMDHECVKSVAQLKQLMFKKKFFNGGESL